MNLKNSSLLMMMAAALVFSACSDDIDAVEYIQQGYIKGTITGTESDDATAIDGSFKYTREVPALNYGEDYSYYEVDDSGGIDVYFYRMDPSTGAAMYFEFYLEDEDSEPVDDDVDYYINFIDETSDNVFYFYMYDNSSNTFSFSNFSFDMDKNRFSAEFSASGAVNSTDNTATISGDFDVVVKQVTY